MNAVVKLTAIGNSTGVVLPKEIVADLNVAKGDALYLTKTPDGYLLTPYNEAFARQVEAADEFMREYRDVLRELAK
jgi:putative addiction module antidote